VLLVQRDRTLLPLSLYLPGLKFLPGLSILPGQKVPPGLAHGSATVHEFDVVAMQAPRVNLCWWGAVCNLTPSPLARRYAVPGFRLVGRRSVYPFTVERFVAVGSGAGGGSGGGGGGASTITASQAWFRLGARPHLRSGDQVETGNEVLVQP
jgi:hypothetical protein